MPFFLFDSNYAFITEFVINVFLSLEIEGVKGGGAGERGREKREGGRRKGKLEGDVNNMDFIFPVIKWTKFSNFRSPE